MSSTKMAPWVKWYPESFLNGVMDLNFAQLAVYTMILNLIYANNGPIGDTPIKMRSMAKRLGMRSDHFDRTLKELVDHGKIVRVDGVMSNARAEREIAERASKSLKLVSNFHASANEAPKNGSVFNGSDNQMGGRTAPKRASREEEEREKEREKRRGSPPPPRKMLKSTRLDPHQKLSDGSKLFARSRGLTPKEIEHEWMIFVRYYASRPESATNSKSTDWNAVWESWTLKKAHELNREPLCDTEHNGKTDPAHLSREVWERSVELWRNTGHWHPDLGPEPGQTGCNAPIDLVRLS